MPTTLVQAAFTGGEWSPALWSRTDLAKYSTACRRLKNFIVHPHGGASTRPGLEYIANTKANGDARLLPFQFNVEDSYILEMGAQYMRVYRDGGQVVLPSAPATWSSGTSYVQGDHCANGGTFYYASQAGTNKDPVTQTAYWHALEGDIVEIPTPYSAADVMDLRFAQSADTLYLAHPSHAPRKLTRSDHHVWKLNTIAFGASVATPTGFSRTVGTGTTGRYAVTAVDADGRESLPTSTVQADVADTLGWSAVSGADHYKVYFDTGGGNLILCTTATTTTCKIPNTSSSSWQASISANPFTGTGNYPAHVAFYQQRLMFARTNLKPQTIWCSRIGDFENFNRSPGSLRVDDACTFTLDSGEMSEIRGLLATDVLIVFTSGGEWVLKAGTSSDALSASNVSLKMQSRWGSAAIQPLVLGNNGVFVQYGARAIRDIAYQFENDGYGGNDLAVLADHLFDGYELFECAYQRTPYSVLWFVRSDGALLGLTYLREHEIWAWHVHDTDGIFESVACVTDGDSFDEAWVIVQRTIDGNTRRFVERFVPRFTGAIPAAADAFQFDAGLSYAGTATTTVSGLDHLAGDDVMALADGSVTDWLTVTAGGTVTLPFAAAKVHVGLPFTAELETMEMDAPPPDGGGTITDRRRAIKSIVIRLRDSRGVLAGPDFDRLDVLQVRNTTDNYGAVALYTGDREIFLSPAKSYQSARICLRNDGPVPITVQAIYPRVEVGR
jgi:hypothetical protein